MYEPVKTFYMGSNPGEAPFLTKVGQRSRQLLVTVVVFTAFRAGRIAPWLMCHL